MDRKEKKKNKKKTDINFIRTFHYRTATPESIQSFASFAKNILVLGSITFVSWKFISYKAYRQTLINQTVMLQKNIRQIGISFSANVLIREVLQIIQIL